jgi:hypothetical protein
MERCIGTKRDGSPCTAPATGANGRCWAHSAKPAALAAARTRGGRARSNTARAIKRLPPGLKPVANLLSDALLEVHSGTLDPRAATAMAAISQAIVRVTQVGELEQKLAELEARIITAGTAKAS